ncbi:MAG: hypothetical protein LQ352_002527 [Teloschistes flavicans]|nr:MAG: hypothetical protein LQ352_002527 [Teloschistes flavicans]
MSMALRVSPPNVIEIDDESDEGQHVRLEDFMTAEELAATLHRPLRATPRLSSDIDNDSDHPTVDDEPQPPIVTFDSCLTEVLEVFPDISHHHVKSLYDDHISTALQVFGSSFAEQLISQILDGGKYPKERDRQNELKRKRSSLQTSDDERAAKWQTQETLVNDSRYRNQVRDLLKQDFPDVPIRFISEKVKELGHLYAAYLAIDQADDAYDTSVPRSYSRLTYPRNNRTRVPPTPENANHPGLGYTDLRPELDAARAQRRKLQTQRQIKRDAAAAEAAEEKELRDYQQVMECGCCFDDVAINKITFCDAEEPHSFCFSCATQNAAVQIGMSKHTLSCMDGSGCKATFSRMERKRFLDAKTIGKLDRLQQQTDLREANLANLESCPFCDFAAICPPIEADREFRCSNPECEKVSCRKCRLITHIPLTCEESKKENGISERHLIEEARTMALLKKCPKCNASVIKEYGCNRLKCDCGAYICDSCGKDITGENYTHFSEGPMNGPVNGTRGKCRTYDNDEVRNRENMDAAEKEAVKKIREENPNISEEDLKIKMDKSTETPRRVAHDVFAQMPDVHMQGLYAGMRVHMDAMEGVRAQMPDVHMQGLYAGMRDHMDAHMNALEGVRLPPWLAARRAGGVVRPLDPMRRNAIPGPIPPYRARPLPYRLGANDDVAADDEQAMLNQVLQVERLAAPQPENIHPRDRHARRPQAPAQPAEPVDDADIGWGDLFLPPHGPPVRRDRHLQRDLAAMEREVQELSAEARAMSQQVERDRTRQREALVEMEGMIQGLGGPRPGRRRAGEGAG